MSSPDFNEGLIASYDKMFSSQAFYLEACEQGGYANVGYFESDTPDHVSACQRFMQHLLSRLQRRDGLVLDVGCGIGGTTACLTDVFPQQNIHGINISEYQLGECRRRLPQAHFHCMPAEQMSFPDAMFDTVVSVEAALHFKGRREFLSEAWRVLKPGGELILADLLFHAEPEAFRKILAGQELYPHLDSYQNLLEASGFAEVSCEDVTRQTWQAYVVYLKSNIVREALARTLDAASFQARHRFALQMEELPVSCYVFVRGVKAGA